MAIRVDLNCDMGELPGPAGLEREMALLAEVTSINLACGVHAGDPQRIRKLAIAAREAQVAVGAHPGYPDRANFGRLELGLTPEAIRDWVLYQVAAVAGMLKAEGLRLSHVKPHGALYNRGYGDRQAAEAMVDALLAHDPECLLVAQAGSELLKAAQQAGLPTASEGFADRSYGSGGELLPRGTPGAVISEPAEAARRGLEMVRDQTVVAADGSRFSLTVDTICVHSDTPSALEIARKLRAELQSGGIEIASLPTRGRLFRIRI